MNWICYRKDLDSVPAAGTFSLDMLMKRSVQAPQLSLCNHLCAVVIVTNCKTESVDFVAKCHWW